MGIKTANITDASNIPTNEVIRNVFRSVEQPKITRNIQA